ncbi:unnamed protein product, partial [Debaryomyces tyrocola]
MNNITFPNNIRRYILERGGEDRDMDIEVDADIDLFEITKFNYRTLFDKGANQNISHAEMVFKFFGIERISDVDLESQSQKLYFKDPPDEWKELFIFFCVMPFTEYEFEGPDGNLSNPDTLQFESFNEEIPESRFANNLRCILRTEPFSHTFSDDQRKKVITNLLYVGFQSKHKLVKHIGSMEEIAYRDNFKEYLF